MTPSGRGSGFCWAYRGNATLELEEGIWSVKKGPCRVCNARLRSIKYIGETCTHRASIVPSVPAAGHRRCMLCRKLRIDGIVLKIVVFCRPTVSIFRRTFLLPMSSRSLFFLSLLSFSLLLPFFSAPCPLLASSLPL